MVHELESRTLKLGHYHRWCEQSSKDIVKILIVASWFPDATSRFSGVFIAEQARALAADNEVTVVVPVVLPSGAAQDREVVTVDGYRVIRLGIPARNFVHQLDYARAIVAEVKSSGCDVIHAHVSLPAGFAAVLAGGWTRCPVIITEHRGPFSALMQSARDRFKVRFALDRARYVIAVSSALARQMEAHGIQRPLQVIPNLVDTNRFKPTPSTRQDGEPFRLLFAGILRDHEKNLPSLLRAFEHLSRGKDQYRLVIVGDGAVRAECESIAQQLGIAEGCSFAGALEPDALAKQMADCDVLVLTSRAETFGIVAAEAMSVGRPVIATRCGGPEDIITSETGRLVSIDDDIALASAIEDVCHRLADYQPAQISAYAHRKFGARAVASQLLEVYRQVIERPAQAGRAALVL